MMRGGVSHQTLQKVRGVRGRFPLSENNDTTIMQSISREGLVHARLSVTNPGPCALSGFFWQS